MEDLELLRDLVDENRMGLLLISHDLAVVTDMADRVTIMRDGAVMGVVTAGSVISALAHQDTHRGAEVPA